MCDASRSQSRYVSQAMRLRDARIQHPRILSTDLLERAKRIGGGNADVEVGALRDIVKEVCRAYGRLLTDHLESIDPQADQPTEEQVADAARTMAIADHRQAIRDLARQYKGFDEDRPAILDMLNPPTRDGTTSIDDDLTDADVLSIARRADADLWADRLERTERVSGIPG